MAPATEAMNWRRCCSCCRAWGIPWWRRCKQEEARRGEERAMGMRGEDPLGFDATREGKGREENGRRGGG